MSNKVSWFTPIFIVISIISYIIVFGFFIVFFVETASGFLKYIMIVFAVICIISLYYLFSLYTEKDFQLRNKLTELNIREKELESLSKLIKRLLEDKKNTDNTSLEEIKEQIEIIKEEHDTRVEEEISIKDYNNTYKKSDI